MTTIVAVRHGETAWNREGRMQGWAPTPLTDRGHDQAAALGESLANEYEVDRIVSSDLHRTAQTTERILEHVDAPVSNDAGWRERDIGVYQGLHFEEYFERFPRFDMNVNGIDAASECPESGESLVAVRTRVVDAWERLVAEAGPEEAVLVVAHGGPLGLLLGHVKGADVKTAILDHHIDNCCVCEFQHEQSSGETTIVRENWTGSD